LLKQDIKPNVSGSNVAFPATFLKPLDYSIDLIMRRHPTLREYERHEGSTEVDPEYQLYPHPRAIEEVKDELTLVNPKDHTEVDFIKSLSKTVSGAITHELRVDNHELPGNFGIKVIEVMPTNIREVFTVKRNNIETEFKCDYRCQAVPDMMQAPDTNDYMTDEESEGDMPEFDVKIPSFEGLITQFEEGDEQLLLNKEK